MYCENWDVLKLFILIFNKSQEFKSHSPGFHNNNKKQWIKQNKLFLKKCWVYLNYPCAGRWCYDECPQVDVKVVLGGFNAQGGKASALNSTIGKNSIHEVINDNGDNDKSHGLVIDSTIFPHKQIHLTTLR